MKTMQNTVKKALSLILALSIIFIMTSCETLSAISALSGVAEDIDKYEKTLSELDNYKITIESVSESGSIDTMTEMRCDKGYALFTGDSITYVEYGTGKMYMLSQADKTGYVYELSSDDDYKNFGFTIYGYLFFFEAYKYLGAKKNGGEKIAGRKTTCYTYNADGDNYKFWIDDEYGLTMKFNVTSDDGTSTMEITEFKINGVTLADMVKLSDYNIQDLASFS